MNNKPLRKRYESLSKFERLALVDHAVSRGDELEVWAINAASPRIKFTQADYGEVLIEVNRTRLANLVIRLSYIIKYDGLFQALLEKKRKKVALEEQMELIDDLRGIAYLYVRATDSWKAITDELGLRVNFNEELEASLFGANVLQMKDELIRDLAFSEEEARDYCFNRRGIKEIRTVESDIEAYRELLQIGKR